MARELADLRDMDLATLVEELRASKQEALNLRFRHATGHSRTPPSWARSSVKSHVSTC